jgi:hypothetical protein
MHLLLIIVILMLAFPLFARFVGSIFSIAVWLIVVVIVVAMVGAFSRL